MKVPKIIHQLWIGEKPAPTNVMDKIKNMNSSYEYMFWNEDKLSTLRIPKKYKQKIDLMEELNGKADMYRWIILKEYGGVFLDADMVSIEPLDDFLLNNSFFCWESEIARPGLCATSIMGLTPNHIIAEEAINFILNNRITSPAWKSVGPQLLSNIYHSLNDKSVVNVFPSYYALPDHLSGIKYTGHGKVYMSHEWGSTFDKYNNINGMDIPPHHRKPVKSITIKIPNNIKKKDLGEIIKGIKNMEGHFMIHIEYDGNIDRYLKSTRFISHNSCTNSEDEDFIFYDENNNIIDHHNVENIEQELCKKFIHSKDIILELGARYGTVSCVCNKIIEDKENHYVVEPDEKVWSALEDNMKLNECKFNIIKGIIGDKKYKLLGNGYARTSIVDNNATGIDTFDIPDVPFNTLVADCEGFIEEFYNSHKEWFKTINKIILECDMPHKCDYKYVIDELKSIGFKIIHDERDSWGLRFLVLTQVCQKT